MLNDRDGFRSTAESVVGQEAVCGTDWEWIVIDGGSTDGTLDEIRQYAHQIAFWQSEKDKGVYDAQNKGIAHAGGEYLLFMNAGDRFYDRQVLKRVMEHGMYGKADYLYGYAQDTLNGSPVGPPDIFPDTITGKMLYKGVFCHQSFFMRTSRVKALGGYDITYRICADNKLLFQDIVLNDATSACLGFFVCLFDITGISNKLWYITHDEQRRLRRELLPSRINDDYYRYCYGGTRLERMLRKFPERSPAYIALTVTAMLIYSPIAVWHRLKMKCKKFKHT